MSKNIKQNSISNTSETSSKSVNTLLTERNSIILLGNWGVVKSIIIFWLSTKLILLLLLYVLLVISCVISWFKEELFTEFSKILFSVFILLFFGSKLLILKLSIFNELFLLKVFSSYIIIGFRFLFFLFIVPNKLRT